MHKGYLLTGYRLFFGLLGFSAVVTEAATVQARGKAPLLNVFSYFTIESNLWAAAILLLSASAVAPALPGRLLALLRGTATLYMATTGIVFAVLLAGIEGVAFTAVPWDNIVLHYIMPVAVTVDWFGDLPTHRLTFGRAAVWFVFPLAYVVYSLIRGPGVEWYPYPFLDPRTHGYSGVAGTSVALAVAVAVFIWVLTRFTGRTRSGPGQR